MNTEDKKFEWTDALVREFANNLFVDVMADEKEIEKFKSSKQPYKGVGFEILSFKKIKHNDEPVSHIWNKCDSFEGKQMYGGNYVWRDYDSLINNKDFAIHSVLRIEDNEVFSIGDKEDGCGKITGFKIVTMGDGSEWSEGLHILGDKEGYHCQIDVAVKVK